MQEGYSKFSVHRTPGVVSWNDDLRNLDRTRTRLHLLGLIGVYPDGVGYGNISLRVSNTRFVITGSGTGAVRELGQKGYSLVTHWSTETNELWCMGPIKASSESLTHGAVYRASREARCVIHVHNRPLFDKLRAGAFPQTPLNVEYGTPEMAHSIAALVSTANVESDILVMAGHEEGVLVYGPSVDAARDFLLDHL